MCRWCWHLHSMRVYEKSISGRKNIENVLMMKSDIAATTFKLTFLSFSFSVFNSHLQPNVLYFAMSNRHCRLKISVECIILITSPSTLHDVLLLVAFVDKQFKVEIKSVEVKWADNELRRWHTQVMHYLLSCALTERMVEIGEQDIYQFSRARVWFYNFRC